MTPYETGSHQVSAIHWRRVIEFTRRKAERNHFLSFLKKTRVSVREAISRAMPTFLQFSPLNRRRSVSSTSSGEYRVDSRLDRSFFGSKSILGIRNIDLLGLKIDFGGSKSVSR